MRHVHFVIRDIARSWPDLAELTEADVDRQAPRFRTGVVNWVLQTYLHLAGPLRAADVTTSISEAIVPHAVNIVHRDSLNGLSRAAACATIIGVRADRPAFDLADFEILQNDVHPLLPHQFYIPFWPQPGIIARHTSRGDRIENMVYLGNTGTASPWLTETDFLLALQTIGVSFEIRAKKWFDYGDIDLVLAHRAEAPCMVVHKPASKLVNAWLAGAPALLGDEPAYLNLRHDPLDYLSVDSPHDVLTAIARLRTQPAIYREMIENGHRRATEFTVEMLRRRWLKLILEVALPEAQTIERGKGWFDQLTRLASQKAKSRAFKWRYRREIELGARFTAPPA
jgi:hypothetical protein